MAKILLAEDNSIIQDIVVRYLQWAGHQAICASNGVEAVALARAEPPDLIVMDMYLPLLDGWQATQQLKAVPETVHIPIIALTASADQQRCMAVGCDDYEPKPIDFTRLIAKIQRFVHQQGSESVIREYGR